MVLVEEGAMESPKEQKKLYEFEDAIQATGIGKFNYILVVLTAIASFCVQFETGAMSYIFPVAQCDLNLNLEDKGLLNAITYSGMIFSGFFWGYMTDAIGRKKIIAYGYLADGVVVFLSTFSQNLPMLIIFKFIGGFIITGPMTALTTYLSEFHATQHRARTQMVLGGLYSLGNILIPFTAYGILPNRIVLELFGDIIVLRSWNLFLLLTSFTGLFSGIAFMFMPESPKFLMTAGRNEEALQVFRLVYRLNTGKPRETYPITKLIEENVPHQEKPDKKSFFKEVSTQVGPLFRPPYIQKLGLVCSMGTILIMSLNTLKLWMPQIFQAIHEYQVGHNGTTGSFCVMLDYFKPSPGAEEVECSVNTDNFSVYVNAMIIGTVNICGYVVAGSLINILGKKRLIYTLGTTSALCVMTLYFSKNTPTTLALISLNLTLGNITADVLFTIIVVVFPTGYRAMALSMVYLCSRFGSTLGNMVFPMLLQVGCAPPLFVIGCAKLLAIFLCIFLPDTNMKNIN